MRIHGPALRAIRERSGLSVTATAAAVTESGVKLGQAHLSNIEAGRRQASPEVIAALARVLKCELLAIVADPREPVAS